MTQQEALDILKTGESVFLTGAAGSGKTHVLNQYIKYLRKESIGVGITASTGIAATHMGGMTIHSWSGISIRDELSEDMLHKIAKRVKKRMLRTQSLIIDEISMLHARQLDLVDRVCRAARESEKPFGGMQVIFSGDFFQLPPVGRDPDATAGAGGGTHFSFLSQAWQALEPVVCYLHESHRHGDERLIGILNRIRQNAAGSEDLALLKKHVPRPGPRAGEFTRLFTHNVDVDAMNHKKLGEIDSQECAYEMESRGSRNLVELLARSCLAPERLVVKEGAVVMFVKNNFDKGYVNGTLGTVVGYGDGGYPVVKTASGERIEASPERWVIEENGLVRASISQVPLRLAWAITVHKSQGMSLDAAEIDLGKTFEKGMGYVALSRVRSLSGLRLLGINDLALRVSEAALNMDADLIVRSDAAVARLQAMGPDAVRRAHKAFLDAVPSDARRQDESAEDKASTYDRTGALLKQGMSPEDIARERDLAAGTILSHIEALVERGAEAVIDHFRPAPEQFALIKDAFDAANDDALRLAPAYERLGGAVSYDDLRLARIFIKYDRRGTR